MDHIMDYGISWTFRLACCYEYPTKTRAVSMSRFLVCPLLGKLSRFPCLQPWLLEVLERLAFFQASRPRGS